MQQIKFGPLEFVARADRTLWHRESCTLFLSDPHLGKGAHFRQAGIPVPDISETADLNRLIQAIRDTQVTSVWVLGDLFHQPLSITEAQITRWQSTRSLDTELKVILEITTRRQSPMPALLLDRTRANAMEWYRTGPSPR